MGQSNWLVSKKKSIELEKHIIQLGHAKHNRYGTSGIGIQGIQWLAI